MRTSAALVPARCVRLAVFACVPLCPRAAAEGARIGGGSKTPRWPRWGIGLRVVQRSALVAGRRRRSAAALLCPTASQRPRQASRAIRNNSCSLRSVPRTSARALFPPGALRSHACRMADAALASPPSVRRVCRRANARCSVAADRPFSRLAHARAPRRAGRRCACSHILAPRATGGGGSGSAAHARGPPPPSRAAPPARWIRRRGAAVAGRAPGWPAAVNSRPSRRAAAAGC